MSLNTIVTASIIATAAAGSLLPSNEEQQRYLWQSFKADYHKSYNSTEEDSRRFGYFLENLKVAERRNAEDTAVHGITKFSDLTQQEFASRYLRADVRMKTSAPLFEVARPVSNDPLIDWSGVFTTPVKDQGYCGSCWAFSATEQIESDTLRQLGKAYVLSPAQVTQCTTLSSGCGGGWTEAAYKWVQNNGLETDADYPYTNKMYQGVTGTCSSVASKEIVTITGYSTINGEASMASYVQSTGPLSVCVDANTWNSYKSGIMSVCGTSVDHCVQAVGVNVADGYWKVRNSWAESWGEAGHIRLKYGANTCAITNDPTFVTAKLL